MAAGHRTDGPRVLIVKTGSTFEGTRRRFGDFDRWFVEALRATDAQLDVRDITRSAPFPVADYDGMIVTGSPAGVYENPPWLSQLFLLLREVADRQFPPSLCVCFGAQALAAALGGTVAVSPHGWEIGTIRVHRTPAGLQDALLGPLPPRDGGEVAFQSTHRDWIRDLPKEAVLLAGNAMSPHQAFRVGERVWGTQFHPEATRDILEDLIRARRRQLVGDGRGPGGGFRAILAPLAPAPAGRELLAAFVRALEPRSVRSG